MSWKIIETVNVTNSDNEVEEIQIQTDGNFYRVENSFGNIRFEFDVSSGYELAEKLLTIITGDINEEITNFLNEKDYQNTMPEESQMNLFGNKHTKRASSKLNKSKLGK